MKCSYGCEKEGVYALNNGKICCSKTPTQCSQIRKKNSDGLKRLYLEGKRHNIFNDAHRQKSIQIKKQQANDNFLQGKGFRSNHYIRKLIVENHGFDDTTCILCNTNKWLGKPLTMHLDHIDGDSRNDNLTNLRFICPNCHSQTETYCSRNINNGTIKISDKDLINCIKQSKNIRQALIKAGLAPKGGNYTRATKLSALIEKSGVEAVKFDETGSIATSSQA